MKVRRVIDPFTVRAGKSRLEWLTELVCAGMSNREIASDMGVSEETVKRYLRELYADKGIAQGFGVRRAKLIVQELPRFRVAGNPAESECAGERDE
jgi:DNA-binding NarL/FixJ family response regulator